MEAVHLCRGALNTIILASVVTGDNEAVFRVMGNFSLT